MTTNQNNNNEHSLRYGLFVPMVLMIASLVSSCFSYHNAKQTIADDLNDAMIALANANSELWTRQDTIAAIRQMHETTHRPMIYQASDLNFRNASLRNEVYYVLALVDKKNAAPIIQGNKIASDSIFLVPEKSADGLAIQVQGFADCSMASVFAASDQTLPGVLFVLSILSMTGMVIWKRRDHEFMIVEPEPMTTVQAMPSIDTIKLTPMQRRFTRMLLEAPDMRVDKSTLCEVLWDNKSNAEESLYTLVRRTKNALSNVNLEIVCNRGQSCELRVKD